jgi:hypothetical protein
MSAMHELSGNADLPTETAILPRYGGQSLLNLPASICAVFGASLDGLAPALDAAVLPPTLLDGVRDVLLLVVDGLGCWQLDGVIDGREVPTLAALAARAVAGDKRVSLATITSVFPSSTMPALATLNTAVPPARHGLIGWTMFLEEFGEIAETPRWGPAASSGSYLDERLGGHDPRAFVGVETIYQRLARAGVIPTALNPAQYRGSGLSRMLFEGANYLGWYATSSLLPLAEQLLATPGAARRYVYCYWDTVDLLAHRRGPRSFEHREELAVLDFTLGRWLARHHRRDDLLFLLTADHGHAMTPADHLVRLDDPGLCALLRAPASGERRLAYLHAQPGRGTDLRAYCTDQLATVAEIIEPETAFQQGWFGPETVGAATRRRAGDLLLLARENVQFVSPASPGAPLQPYLGNHGGLTEEEMLVPLLAVRV